MGNKNKKISAPTDADRLIDSIDAQIESNKDKTISELRAKNEDLQGAREVADAAKRANVDNNGIPQGTYLQGL